MAETIIRDAREEDVESLGHLLRDSGHSASAEETKMRFSKIHSNPLYDTLVADQGGRIVGMLGFTVEHRYEKNEDHVRISTLAIDKKNRDTSVSQALMEAAENRARRWGVRSAEITSDVHQAEIHRFYNTLGYKATGYRFSKSLEAPGIATASVPTKPFSKIDSTTRRIALGAGVLLYAIVLLSIVASSGDVFAGSIVLAIGAVPVVLLARALRSSATAEGRKLTKTGETLPLERQLLDALAERGEINPTSAAMVTTATATDASSVLEEMARKGYVETRIRDGFLAYALREQDRHWLKEQAKTRSEPPPTHTSHEMPSHSESSNDMSDVPTEDLLSERELEVLRLLATGRSNREISQDLFVAPGTVKAHTNNIYRKLESRNRTETLSKARDLGLLE